MDENSGRTALAGEGKAIRGERMAKGYRLGVEMTSAV